MGYIKRLNTNADIQAFPGALFELTGDVPAPQCSEAKIEGDAASTQPDPVRSLLDAGKFVGFTLDGKVCTITVSPTGTPGDYDIVSNTDGLLTLVQDPGGSGNVEYYVHDGGSLILTRNAKSFAEYIHAAGYAYTIKGGKLYTNIPSGQLKDACTILFDPIT